ncbi:MAG: dTMP kinase [Eubacteriales bacterium]|nr:dTMP kinase [Eubacteriales bacterium]
MEAKFIAFEGLDGSGKSTQIRMLAERLRMKGRRVAVTAEPTVSALGGLVRDSLSGFTKRTDEELAALFLADRVAHNVNPIWGIEKLLGDGNDVITDRYYYSSFAYQGLRTDEDWVYAMNLNCPAIRRPDLCIFLDLDTETARKRMAEDRSFREIFENSEAQRAVRERYMEVFRFLEGRENICIVNAAASAEEVADAVFSHVQALF